MGDGDPVLLLHGFPQTGLMWREIAPALAETQTVIVADLPGYGRSDPPGGLEVRNRMLKRAMGQMLREAMGVLGHDRFGVVGHDRGGRVAYRMALDHQSNISRLVVMDIVPTAEVWERADADLALAFWPYSLLAQPAPLPESLLLASPEAVVEDALTNWGTPRRTFSREVRDAYVAALRNPSTVSAICDEYRAAATVDRRHDEEDRGGRRRIACPTLVLWDEEGGVGRWYERAGGPLAIWRRWAVEVSGAPMKGGHFFPESDPEATQRLLGGFLAR